MGILDFLANGQQRRQRLDEAVGDFMTYITPPNLRPAASMVAQMNPIQGMANSMQSARVAFDPQQTAEARRRAAMDMGVDMAMALTPAALASRGYMTPAVAAMEGLLGGSPTTKQIGDDLGRFAVDEAGSVGLGLPDSPLIAHHNLSREGVRAAYDIGGIPMPSLAISRADYPLENFGDITLLADPAMVKPSRSTGVWDADVYTGRQPKGDVEFVDSQSVANALKADPDFGHMRDITYFMDMYDDFGRADEAMKVAQVGRDAGISPSDFDRFDDYVRAVRKQFNYQPDAALMDDAMRLLDYGDTQRVLYPADRFTPSGNRRKPKPYTLENVTRYMRGQNAGAPATENMTTGPSKFRAASANRFSNMAGIKSAREKIIPSDEAKASFEDFNNDYFALVERLAEKFGGGFSGMDTAGAVLEDVASGRNYRDWFDGELSDDTLIEIKALSKRAADLPTEYFEAKPQRAVTLSEFQSAIVPEADVASQGLLRDAGVRNILTYGTKDERGALFKRFPELLFSAAGVGLLGSIDRER